MGGIGETTLAKEVAWKAENDKLFDQAVFAEKNKTILMILDNIWENLDLLAVGIPHGNDHKGCKILLTARSEDTLSRKMDSKQNFSVGILKEEEAWSLFKKMAGDY
ncbi:hypothetical protein WN944_007406 [Citrus x changshan-huyou]|uniref:NB-ARC domain-containing protein n=1 Tax=Citrus x changshan-huyou TaxID=2935761 RepID=A0AAP0QU70_9ROSI